MRGMRFLAALLLALLCAVAPALATSTTWNSGDKDAAITLSGGDLTASQSSAASAWRSVRSTSDSYFTGKYYFEATASAIDGSDGWIIGIANASAPLNTFAGGGGNATGYQSGAIFGGAGGVAAIWVQGDILGFAVDLDNNKMWVTKDGATWGVAQDPSTNTGGHDISAVNDGVSVMIIFSGYDGGSADTVLLNAGASAFNFSVPSGFTRWTPLVGGGGGGGGASAGSLGLRGVGH